MKDFHKIAESDTWTRIHVGHGYPSPSNIGWGSIESCKMHDLMHDLAEEVAGVKCKFAKFGQRDFNDKLLHLSFAYQLTSSWEIPKSMKKLKLLRTFVLPEQIEDGSPFGKRACQQLLTRFGSLRVLNMNNLGLESLPSSIDKLVHLRYIDLSYNPIEKLPNSITKLWNLQTLSLYRCIRLRKLPTKMRKLTNLRSLNVLLCQSLTYMPSGIDELTLLNKLPQFIVGREHSTEKLRNKPTSVAKLGDLMKLKHLRGVLQIVIHNNLENNMLEAREEPLSSKHGLTYLKISFSQNWHFQADNSANHDGEAVLEGLKPPSYLKRLYIENYIWHNFPNWARMDNLCLTLPYLVEVRFGDCGSCQLPIFSQLRLPKYLDIYVMQSVEYMEDVVYDISSSTTSSTAPVSETIFFPSLEVLELDVLTNLKGWWKEVEAVAADNDTKGATHESTRQFPKLSKLSITRCPQLRMLPLCPNVEDLTLLDTNDSLSVLKMATITTTTTATTSSSRCGLKLKRLTIDNAEDLMSSPNHPLHQLSVQDKKLESSDRLEEVFATLSSSLRSLEFRSCEKLKSISKGLEHLTALENLAFKYCRELDITGDEGEDKMPWEALNKNLLSLTLWGLPKLVSLPNGLQCLTKLRSLVISLNDEVEQVPEWIDCFSSLKYLELCNCPKLECLPDAFRNTSLNELQIVKCPGLTERCRQPNGSDWPKIQHIPFVSVLETFN